MQRPAHELKGFKKDFLAAGESARVEFELDNVLLPTGLSMMAASARVKLVFTVLRLCTSSRDIVSRETIGALRETYAELNEWSNFGEFKKGSIRFSSS